MSDRHSLAVVETDAAEVGSRPGLVGNVAAVGESNRPGYSTEECQWNDEQVVEVESGRLSQPE